MTYYDDQGGYNYNRGMSNRACRAYEENKQPLSQFTTYELQEQNIKITLAFAKYLAELGVWRFCEWHHTSGAYNETKFYDLADLSVALNDLTKEELADHKASHQREQKEKREYAKAQKLKAQKDIGRKVAGYYLRSWLFE